MNTTRGSALDAVSAVTTPASKITIRQRHYFNGLLHRLWSRAAFSEAAVAPLPASGGSGLIGLAERLALVGGELEHGTNTDGDFVLRATIQKRP
jgi:hypothetical protein